LLTFSAEVLEERDVAEEALAKGWLKLPRQFSSLFLFFTGCLEDGAFSELFSLQGDAFARPDVFDEVFLFF